MNLRFLPPAEVVGRFVLVCGAVGGVFVTGALLCLAMFAYVMSTSIEPTGGASSIEAIMIAILAFGITYSASCAWGAFAVKGASS